MKAGPWIGQMPELQKDPEHFGMSPEDRISCLADLTQQIYLVVERELRLTGFWRAFLPATN